MKTPERGLVTEAMKNRLVHLEGGIVETAVAYSKVKKALCGTTNATLSEVLQTVDQLKSRLAQAERERDAAVNDLNFVKSCWVCENKRSIKGEPCNSCDLAWRNHFKWRGVCPENTKEESK